MAMKNPPHPGEIIRDLCLEPLSLSVTQATAGLGVTRKTLSLLFARSVKSYFELCWCGTCAMIAYMFKLS